VDADPTFHPDANPDPDTDPSFQIKAQTLEKCSNRLLFHTLWLVISKLMQIRIRFLIQLITLMWIRMQIRILIFIWRGSRWGSGFLFDADVEFLFDADVDADPGYPIDADSCESGFTTLLGKLYFA
jgi:hypothetical protein